MLSDPIAQFARWFAAAKRCQAIADATAMCLSTIDPRGFPDARMVLLKDFDERGFVFYTNLRSIKGKSLEKTPRAALTFYWEALNRQVRIQGPVERVPDAEADAYWQSRPRLAQLGAWASQQSSPLPSRAVLLKDVARLSIKLGLKPVPRPAWWTGIRVKPLKFEFWQARPSRLHDRFLYTPHGLHTWRIQRLYP